jgi:hypothetical protein
MIYIPIITVLVIFLYAAVVFFVSVEAENDHKINPDFYQYEFENLKIKILNAVEKCEIKNLCEAVYLFSLNYRKQKEVEKHTDTLIQMLDKKLYEINGRKTESFIFTLN